MEKNLNLKLVAWFLAATFIMRQEAVYPMDTIKSKTQWIKTKTSRVKEKTLDRLVKWYRDTQELRRKKVEGTATVAELKELKRRMKNTTGAVAIGITIVTIAAIAGSTLAYGEYRKRKMAVEKEAERQKERGPEEAQVFFKNLIGHPYALVIKRGETVAMVKEKLQEKYEVGSLRLIFMGYKLKDEDVFPLADVVYEGVVHVFQRR